MAPRFPSPLLAAVLVMGTLGGGRAFLMILFGWAAYRAGATTLHDYLPFAAHFGIGIVVLGIAVGVFAKIRGAWITAILACLGLLLEEAFRLAYIGEQPGGFTSPRALGSIIYLLSIVVLFALLVRKNSRNYLSQNQ
jgi:hypothetical protein